MGGTYKGGDGLFKFQAEQKVYQIGNVTIGGQPGQYPTVLMASIFYQGDKLVKDEEKGIFDQEGALCWINKIDDMCKKVGVPLMIDIVGASENAMRNYVEFIGCNTDLPLIIDGTVAKVRIAGVEMAAKLGLQDRVVFDSVNAESRAEELEEVKKYGLKTTIVMLNNSKKPTAQGRVDIADVLIERAKSYGFEKLLLDMAVLDIIEPGPAAKAIYMLKDKYGYPAGCSPTHTVITGWKKAYMYNKIEIASTKTSMATSLQLLGADFIMYGIKQTEIVPSMAAVDALVAYSCMQYGVRPASHAHPLYHIFK
jgi:tetrahydromethanopterin S-methyltransferase subunit H